MRSIVRCGLIVAGSVLAATVVAADRERPDFSGAWQLNEELSDDVRQKVRDAIRSRMRGGGMGGRGGPSGPGGGGGRGGRMEQARERMRQMQEGMQRLTIAQTDSEMIVVNAIDREQRFFTDGRKQTREGGFGPVEFEASWKKRSLMVIEKPEGQGATVTRVYFFRRDDPHLYVHVKVEGRGPVFEYQRVYDRTEPPSPEGD